MSSLVSQSYNKRSTQLNKQLKDLIVEAKISEALLDRVKVHTEHMVLNMMNVTSTEKFLQFFTKVNSSLLAYVDLLTDMNCNIEMTLTKEINIWNSICHGSELKEFNFHICENPGNCECLFPVESGDTVKRDCSVKSPCAEVEKDLKFKSSVPSQAWSNTKTEQATTTTQLEHNKQRPILNIFKEKLNDNLKTKSDPRFEESCTKKLLSKLDLEASSRKTNSELLSLNRKKTEVSLPVKKDCSVEKIENANSYELLKSLSNEKHISRIKITGEQNELYAGIIEHIVSPKEFYVYFATEETAKVADCDEELKALSKYCKHPNVSFHNKKDCPPNVRKKFAFDELGNYALLCLDNDVPVRVQIKDWKFESNTDIVTSYLVDYGKSMDVDVNNLFPMPEHLFKYPAFALRCHLCNLEKSETDIWSQTWNSKMTNVFNRWAVEGNEISLAIDNDSYDEESDSIPVRIYDLNGTECLNQLIANLADKVSVAPDLKSTSFQWNPMTEDFDSNSNSYDYESEEPATTIYGYADKDPVKLCRQFSETGKCSKGLSCRKEHSLTDPAGFTIEKEEVFKDAFHSLRIPTACEIVPVDVTTIISATEFYCVLNRSFRNSEETLPKLIAFMNQRRNICQMKKLSIPPSVAQIVAVKSIRNDLWYRGKVLDVMPESDIYTIFFVDNGHTEIVSLANLRSIEPQYLYLPFQAIRCQIQGVKENPAVPVQETIEHLKDLIGWGGAKVQVHSVLPGPILVVTLKVGISDVAQDMLGKRYFIPVDSLIPDKSNTLFPG